jgi:hypothetical protein
MSSVAAVMKDYGIFSSHNPRGSQPGPSVPNSRWPYNTGPYQDKKYVLVRY